MNRVNSVIFKDIHIIGKCSNLLSTPSRISCKNIRYVSKNIVKIYVSNDTSHTYTLNAAVGLPPVMKNWQKWTLLLISLATPQNIKALKMCVKCFFYWLFRFRLHPSLFCVSSHKLQTQNK